MYIIQNKTKNTTTSFKGSFPITMLENLLNKGDKLIVISLYSNTLKVPYSFEEYEETCWEWKDFPLIKKNL